MEFVRPATANDAAGILSVYAPYVSTSISFELEVPSEETMTARIKNVTQTFPWLVYEEDSIIKGYAYASPHHDRLAYQWSCDLALYVHQDWRGKGVGKALYSLLFPLLRRLGFFIVIALIAVPNPASIAIHENMGMEKVGVYHKIGYKNGTWHDVALYEGKVQPCLDDGVAPPLKAGQVDIGMMLAELKLGLTSL
eukprot:TRINITY_DN15353_c0_g1_i1.p1 TRINITY_DN15353_c0_g1~~TRINITY_DN15353_c0_g1_i1.p1  ORF type:complete len:195 (-),score=21.76 TRINITY_DN15353_c0_g1_i1:88-672(-)